MTTYDTHGIADETEECEPPPVSFFERAKYTATTALLLGGGLELMGTGMTGLILAGVGASAAAYFSPEIKETLEKHFGPKVQEAGRHIDWKRLGAKSYPTRHAQRASIDAPAQTSLPLPKEEDTEEWDESWYDQGDDEDVMRLPSKIRKDTMFTFSDLLQEGFVPTLHKIFLARLPDGTDVFVGVKDLCHVALAGLTGNGKSSIMRLIVAQLCRVGVRVLLLNPHYMRYDRGAGEDWTPFEKYLDKPPVDCATYGNIRICLEWMVKTLLPARIARSREGKAIGKPFFVVIDELPAIVAEIKEAPAQIAKLLREGRKYGIFLIVASQDFLVKTIGMDGGGVRKCLRTAYYVGGDVTTANVLLNDVPDRIPENDLGKGTIMLRCAATSSAVLAKVPYVDNESLYRLLGPSTFTLTQDMLRSDEEDAQDEEFTRNDQPENPRAHAQNDGNASYDFAQRKTMRSDQERAQPSQMDERIATLKYRLSEDQIRQFFAIYPDLIKNKDHALAKVGANTAYRAHINLIIQQRRERG